MAHLWATKMLSSLATRCPLQPIVPLYRFDPAAWASGLHGYSCGQESECQWKAKSAIVLPPPQAIPAPQERALYLGLKSRPTSCVQMCGACVFSETQLLFCTERRASITLAENTKRYWMFVLAPWKRSMIFREACARLSTSLNLGDFKTIMASVKNQPGFVQFRKGEYHFPAKLLDGTEQN